MEEYTINWYIVKGILKFAIDQWLSISKRQLFSAIEGLSDLSNDENKIKHLLIDFKIRVVSVSEADF